MNEREPCTLKSEQKKFRERTKVLRSSFLNWFFILDTRGAALRLTLLRISFFLFGVFFSGQMLKETNWTLQLGESFQYILAANKPTTNPLPILVNTLTSAIFAPEVLRLIPVFVAPFFMAYRAASLYLADIYELADNSISHQFIWEAAFGSEYDEVVIENGEVAEKYKNSPILHIGGPGRVKVDLYSAALFEKPNGRPHVIGPTFSPAKKLSMVEKIVNHIVKIFYKKPGGEVIEGFERLRTVVDLRDQIIEPTEVFAHTLDGIKVGTKDVRMVYSIWRGNPTEEDMRASYPFRKEALPSMFYQQSHKVNVSAVSGKKTSWSLPASPMPGRVKGEMSAFIAKRPLSQFLTAVGEPEKDGLKGRSRINQEEREKVIQSDKNVQLPSGEKFDTPPFEARDKIKELFSEFAEEFSNQNRKKGVQLYWLGTGTWTTPDEIIPEKNLEAWRLSKENSKKGNEKKLNGTENEEKLTEFMRLVQRVPLNSAKISNAPNSYHEDVIQQTLEEYRELIKNAKTVIETYNETYPDLKSTTLEDAAKEINTKIDYKFAHWVSSTGKPDNSTAPVG